MKIAASSPSAVPQRSIISRWGRVIVRTIVMMVLTATTHYANAQTLYVADSLTNDFYSTTPNGTDTTLATGLNYPTGLAVDGNGNFYVSNNSNNTVAKITFGTWKVSTYVNSGLSSPSDLAFDISGDLFVRNEGNGSISKITPGGTVSSFATGLSNFQTTNTTSGMVFDGSGDLYVGSGAKGSTQSIIKITPGGAKSTFVSGNLLNGPAGLVFDGSGNLFVANLNAHNILEITSGGTQSVFATLPGGTSYSPQSVSFDSKGDLFVGTYGPAANNYVGNLYEIAAGSTTPVIVGSGLPYDAVSFSQVPEPSGILLVGASGMLALLRRGRRNIVPAFK